MTKTISEKNTVLYQCEACGLKYAAQETAGKCLAWCTEHKSCNLDIIKEAVREAQPLHD
jgi:hypothetical protein